MITVLAHSQYLGARKQNRHRPAKIGHEFLTASSSSRYTPLFVHLIHTPLVGFMDNARYTAFLTRLCFMMSSTLLSHTLLHLLLCLKPSKVIFLTCSESPRERLQLPRRSPLNIVPYLRSASERIIRFDFKLPIGNGALVRENVVFQTAQRERGTTCCSLKSLDSSCRP